MMRAARILLTSLTAAAWLGLFGNASGMDVVLKDGRVLRGKRALVSSLNPLPAANHPDSAGDVPLIEVLDDDLRRIFVSIRQVAKRQPEEGTEVPEKFRIRQLGVSHAGQTVKVVGPLSRVDPFDQFGRRRVQMVTAKGTIDMVQAITEITPSYVKAEGIRYVWDMRIATSSIPHEELAAILKGQCKKGDIEDIKRIARFYLQCERYEDAAKELQDFIAANPDDATLKTQLQPSLDAIKQLSAKRMLSELLLRREAGQHQFVLRMLKKFPTEGTAGETVQAAREAIRQYEADEATRKQTVERIAALVKQVGDATLVKRLEPIVKEISAELNANTLDRMSAFREMVDDATLQPSDKLGLAISGWLLGAKQAIPRLSTALSLVRVRSQIVKYFAAPDSASRQDVLLGFRSEEGSNPALVARVLANMKPPVAVEPPEDESQPFEFEVPGLGSTATPVRCYVQLPPEYDPLRRYPAIVTLNAGFTPEQQIDWWAGPRVKGGWRAGQASRRGYIVIAPEWTANQQKQYDYSAREHAAVLDSLRGACQRFSIDTDRVYLTGHSFGGDAAWDIGLAHPDLWAGVIPIAAKADKYCTFYWENAALLPFYFVCGELDSNRMLANSRDWDRYLNKGYNVTIVEYQGRGHESFSDDILRIFDWMGRMRRNFSPKEFRVASMRPWDNFFWWLEMRQFPPRSMVAPDEWPPRDPQAVHTKGTVTKANGILVQTGAAHVVVWLSPDVVDLTRRFTVTINGHSISTSAASLTGDLNVMLEDARARGDLQHPFWSKVETPTGRLGRN